MSERDTNFDQATTETEGTVDPQAREFEMPSCCGPMMERMMKPQLEQFERMLEAGQMEFTMEVKELRVNTGPPRQ